MWSINTHQYPSDYDLSFFGQMKMLAKDNNSWDYVYPMKEWKLKEYQLLFKYITKEILVQADDHIGFIFNEVHHDYKKNIKHFKKLEK